MKALLALIKKLYGSKALQNAIGTRTNVITLPDKDTKRFITNELNIEVASDAAVEKAFKDAEKLIPDIPKMNDQEILTFTGNLQRLDNKLNPASAPIIDIKTKKPVTGIEKLAEERGFPKGMEPDSPLGQLLQSSRRLEDEAKDLQKMTQPKTTEELYEETRKAIEEPTEAEKKFRAKEKERIGIPFQMGDVKGTATADELFDMITKNPARSGGPLDPNVGIVRTAARQILRKRLDAGEIDIPDAAERKAIAEGYQGGVDPIEVFRKRFGEDALQDLDEIADELNRARDFNQIDDILKRNKLFDVEPKKDYGYQEGSMTDEELRKKLKEFEEPEDFATGGRVEMASGGIAALKTLIRFLGKQSGKTGSQNLADINPKRLGYLENMLMKSDKDMLYSNRIEYLEQLSDIIKGDRRLLNKIKDLPEETREAFYKSVNEGGNKGRLDVYKDINIDDAILDIEQMIKNLKFKDVPEDAIKRQMNAGGGVAYLMGL